MIEMLEELFGAEKSKKKWVQKKKNRREREHLLKSTGLQHCVLNYFLLFTFQAYDTHLTEQEHQKWFKSRDIFINFSFQTHVHTHTHTHTNRRKNKYINSGSSAAFELAVRHRQAKQKNKKTKKLKALIDIQEFQEKQTSQLLKYIYI